MENVFYTILTIVGIALFLYYGYIDDYRRNPKQFIRIVVGIPLAMISAAWGIFFLPDIIRKWIRDAEK